MKFKKIHDYLWEIPKENKMNVPGRIYASKPMIDRIMEDNSPLQVQNVSQLPGIVNYSMAMPDIHWGYGFPIGGVAAFDLSNGVISPGGVGYDINCGVRLLRTAISSSDIQDKIPELVDNLFHYIPSGVGSKGDFKVSEKDLKQVMVKGARWIVEQGYGDESDLEKIEEHGQMEGADPSTVSDKAIKRGLPQLGTLGSGNHFVEIQYVEEVYDDYLAQRLGLFPGQITVSIHTGSRGFGYQICDDYIHTMIQASQKYGIELPDRQLCCAPINSPEGQKYFAAMVCAVNYAFANRQVISYWVREAFMRALNLGPKQVQFDTVYEVAHNIAKIETHIVDGKPRQFCVHRKGATRAFGPGRVELPEIYRDIGQPVLIPGDMGRCSYVLIGTNTAMDQTFGSTCHGAGRLLSRNQAIKAAKGRAIHRELEDRGIIARAASRGTMAEEMPEAYKDVSEVVDAVVGAGISKKVAKLRPLGVIKG
ncbi:MAG: RtcB family protein [candidate division KSB1 bacterium]|nr:RtcB family protein [candidate division KSB1 bacterium]MDZ7333672.1 RtcB family protein [candidate division KSB1 bacterium]MDZ7356120.1 RtcB family protein [candidate division KSB1 bacterium]MDZ7398903.1 RtcB family protein [candidate division KSB1 bacterium]